MYYKKLLSLGTVLLLISALGFFLTQLWGTPLRSIFAGIFAVLAYGVFILGFIAQFVLILLGVFSIYRALLARHNQQPVA